MMVVYSFAPQFQHLGSSNYFNLSDFNTATIANIVTKDITIIGMKNCGSTVGVELPVVVVVVVVEEVVVDVIVVVVAKGLYSRISTVYAVVGISLANLTLIL